MCNKCNKKRCDCEQPSFCGCKTKTEFGCVNYTGASLEPLGITPGMNGDVVIKIINDYIMNFIDNLEIDPTVLTNIGGKVEIYKGLSSMFNHELRTIEGTSGVIVEPAINSEESCDTGEYINIRLDLEWLDDYICQKVIECGGVTPPHTVTATDINIGVEHLGSYEFTPQDFINNFNDSNPTHTLVEIQLYGDVTGVSYNSIPYVAGTWIAIGDVYGLTYTAPTSPAPIAVSIPWRGKDNEGVISN